MEPRTESASPSRHGAVSPARVGNSVRRIRCDDTRASSQVGRLCCDAAAAMLTELSPCRMRSRFEKPSKTLPSAEQRHHLGAGQARHGHRRSVPEHRGNGGSPDACSCSSASGDAVSRARCRSLKTGPARLALGAKLCFHPAMGVRRETPRREQGVEVWSNARTVYLVWSVRMANAREALKRADCARVTRGRESARPGSASALRGRRDGALPPARKEKTSFPETREKTRDRQSDKSDSPRTRVRRATRRSAPGAAARLALEDAGGRRTPTAVHRWRPARRTCPTSISASRWAVGAGQTRCARARARRRSRRALGAKRKRSRAVRIARRC